MSGRSCVCSVFLCAGGKTQALQRLSLGRTHHAASQEVGQGRCERISGCAARYSALTGAARSAAKSPSEIREDSST